MSAAAVLAASLVRAQANRQAVNDAALAHFVIKGLSGRATTVSFIGDSGLEGNTADNPGTDDAASLLVAELNARYAGTVTKSNHANSGYTAARMMTVQLPLVLAEAPDLVVISAGHNDITSDIASPGDGYPKEASMAAIEHMIRAIRVKHPLCSVIVTSEWPYASGSSSNAYLNAYNDLLEEVARHNGAAFVDGNQPFIDQGDYSGFLTGSHPNSAGHDLWADALIDAIPSAYRGPVTPPPVPAEPLRTVRFDRRGVQSVTASSTTAYTNKFRTIGTWAGTSPYESSTANDTVVGVFLGSEIMLRLRGTGVCHVDIDGVRVAASLNLGASETRVPFTGLYPGLHGVKVTVVSGTVGFYGFDLPYTPCEVIGEADERITYSGTWTTGAETNMFTNTKAVTTDTTAYLEFEFVGTGVSMMGFRQVDIDLVVTIDGVAGATADYGSGGSASVYGGTRLASGLTYGRHKIRVANVGGGGSNSLQIGGFAIDNDKAHRTPTRFEGWAKVGSTVRFPATFASVPRLSFPTVAEDGTVLYGTSLTSSGFTMAGTAGQYGRWVAEGDRVIY